jgi:hypothetical protein
MKNKPTNALTITYFVYFVYYMFRPPSATILRVYSFKKHNKKFLCGESVQDLNL